MGLDRGLWAVLPTPFDGDGALDRISLAATVAHYVDGGAVGLVALGVFGEAAALEPAERATVVGDVVAAAPDHDVVVGLSARDTADAQREAEVAVTAGGGRVRALMVQLNSASAEAIADHVRSITATAGIPVVLQDYPKISGVHVPPAVLAAVLAHDLPVAAVKMESPPTAPAIAELTGQTAVPVFGGLGGTGLLDELLSGAAGAMTGFSWPHALDAALRAWRTHGFEGAWAAISPWLAMMAFEGQAEIGVAVRKENLRRQGVLASATVRGPARGLPPGLAAHFAAHERIVRQSVTHRNTAQEG